jgi:hypothetical protein
MKTLGYHEATEPIGKIVRRSWTDGTHALRAESLCKHSIESLLRLASFSILARNGTPAIACQDMEPVICRMTADGRDL